MAEVQNGQQNAVPQGLATLAIGQSATVQRVNARDHAPTLVRRLAEIGFFPGEVLRVMAKAPGGDPLVVRIGSSTFALRRHEAACIDVTPQ